MNNKFNIGDKVTVNKLGVAEGWLLETYIVITGKQVGKISVKDTTGEVWHIPSEYVELIEPNTIEEDTQEGETVDEISFPESPYIYEDGVLRWNSKFEYDGNLSNMINQQEYDPIGKQAPAGLDYEKEYYKSMSEHAETKELLEIAKVALKLTTELISTND